jgi:hypothetical protein
MSNFKVQNKSKAQMVKFNLEQNFFGIHPFDIHLAFGFD